MKEIEKQISRNYKLLSEIKDIHISIKIEDEHKRKILLIGFFENALDYYQSITLLIEQKLYHSALALIRVFFDNIVRGLYMYNIFSNDDIKHLYKSNNWDDKRFFKFKMNEMCEAIDKHYGKKYGEISFSKTKEIVYKDMCDYTHSGASQITRSFNNVSLSIEANFSDKLILSVLSDSHVMIAVFSSICFDQLNEKETKKNG